VNVLPNEWFQSMDKTRHYVGELLQEHTQREHCDCHSTDCEEYFSCESELSDTDAANSLSSEDSFCTLYKGINNSVGLDLDNSV